MSYTVIQHLYKSAFVKNTTVLFSGKLVVTAIGFLATPIVSRLFDPSQYGVFNLYFAVTAIFCVIATGGYNNAILLQKSTRDIHNAIAFIFLVTLVVSFVICPILLLVFSFVIDSTLGLETRFYYLLIFGTYVSALAITLPPWNLRRKQFKQSATIEVLGKSSMRVFQISGGLLVGGFSWILALGDIFGKAAIVLMRLYFTVFREFGEFRANINFGRIWDFGKAFKSYPLYDMPAQLLRTFGQQVPIYATTIFFDLSHLGQYAMATGLIYIPSQLLSTSLSSVFFEDITNKVNRKDYTGVMRITQKMIVSIFILGVIPSAILITYGEEILTIFLGEDWKLAGDVGSVLALFLLTGLLIGPATALFRVFRREKVYLQLTAAALVSNSTLFLSGALFGEFYISVLMFSISNFIWNIVIIWKAMAISGLSPMSTVSKGVAIYALIVSILLASRVVVL